MTKNFLSEEFQIKIKNPYCIECLSKDVEVVQTESKIDKSDENQEVLFFRPLIKCNNCGAISETNESSQAIQDARLRSMNFLTPSEIKSIRKSLPESYNQEKFAALIGVSLASVSRWELGKSFPNESYDSLMYLLKSVDGVYKSLYEKNIQNTYVDSQNSSSKDSILDRFSFLDKKQYKKEEDNARKWVMS